MADGLVAGDIGHPPGRDNPGYPQIIYAYRAGITRATNVLPGRLAENHEVAYLRVNRSEI
jgi:predicted glycoside hydrolase/deacetylase ChbG (UPF0249 family)